MFDFKKIPGDKIEQHDLLKNKSEATITIITPFYNAGATLEQTVNSVLSQTYPFFEWIIVDDGSKDKESLKKLEKMEKKDSRIRVFHKENGGPSQARDFGISKASKKTKYIYFLDADDIIDKTMIECLYWALETQPEASFAYTAMANFGAREFIWDKYLTTEIEKHENLICISSMVRKKDLLEVGCFDIKEKAMYEDWNLWLKLIAAGKKPLRINAPLFWYRTSDSGELSRAKENHKLAMKYVDETAAKITKDVEIIQYPRVGNGNEKATDISKIILPMYEKNEKKTVLFLIPWMIIGGADLFNLDILKRIDKKKFNTIVLTMLPANNALRQEFQEYATQVYDLSTFIDRKDYYSFTDYIINSRNVETIFLSNCAYAYAMLPMIKLKYKKISIIDYVHSVDLKANRGGFGGLSSEFDEFIDATFTCNNFTKEQLINDFGKTKVETLYIGTDDKKFDPEKYDRNILISKYGIPKNKKIISYIARFSEEKRPEVFVDIAKQLSHQRDDVFFLMVGNGDLYNNITKKIAKHNLKDKVQLFGSTEVPEEIYAISDLTVNCSRLEGLALTSYESLSMGVPVVSANVGGQKELISNDVGRIVPYGVKSGSDEIDDYCTAINEVLANIKKIKSNSRKYIINSYGLNNTVKKLENIFNETKPKSIKKTNDKIVYDLYTRLLSPDYKWLCNEFTLSNYGVSLYANETLDKNVSLTKKQKLKQKLMMLCKKYEIKTEALVILNLYRTIVNIFREFIRFFKYLIKSLIAILLIIYKMIKKIIFRLIKK